VSEPRATVVGSGPNGLCAAIRLAQAGLSVQVLEAADEPGGGVRSGPITESGFIQDHCSSIHPMAMSSPFLSQLPLAEHGLEWVQPPVPCAHPLDDQKAVLLHRSVDETAAALGPDADRYRRWMGPLVERWEDLCSDALAPLGWPAHPMLLARFGWSAFQPARSLARRRFRGEAGRALFAGMAGHSVMPLDRRPSAAIGMMLQVAGHAVGWPLPRGGSGALSAALISLLRSLGGEVHTGRRVDRLEALPEGPVLFDTSPQSMAQICGEALPRGYRRRLARFKHGPGLFKLDWALSEPIPWRDPAVAQAATVHLGGTLDEIHISEKAAWEGTVAESPFVLLTQCSLFDTTRAPEGGHTAWAYCHVPAGSEYDATEAILRQVERFAPGFRDCIRSQKSTSPGQLQNYNANYIGGDVNGGAPTLGQLFTRPVARIVPYRTPHPSIWICSASTPPGGGVHGMCGFHAAEDVLHQNRRLIPER
jgi:phytoene dehydrogenase-like protein